jgi:hypothetical protein
VEEIRMTIGARLTDDEARALHEWYAALAARVAEFPHADLKPVEPPLRSLPGPSR